MVSMFHCRDILINTNGKISYPSQAYNQVERSSSGTYQEGPTFISRRIKKGQTWMMRKMREKLAGEGVQVGSGYFLNHKENKTK